jgi:hypothetical protein
MRTAWNAMNRDESTPYTRDSSDGTAWAGRSCEGVTPVKKPMVTTTAARMTFFEGLDRVLKEETTMVRGRTSPRAI